MGKALWRSGLALVRKVGYLQSQLILTLVYFVIMVPFALAVRLFTDPLGLRRSPSRLWAPDDGRSASSLSALRQQF